MLTMIRTSGLTVGNSAAIKCLSSTREKSPVYKIYIFYALINKRIYVEQIKVVNSAYSHTSDFNHEHGSTKHVSSLINKSFSIIKTLSINMFFMRVNYHDNTRT